MRIFCLFILLLCSSCCSYFKTTRSKNLPYHQVNSGKNSFLTLNVFSPKKNIEKKEVLVFIHGGSWESGSKSLYSFLGNRMAAKGFVTVIIDYSLSPARYDQMAYESAKSVKWVQENIKTYGGDPEKIFISGHSAGGHLAALIAVDNKYFNSIGIKNPIKGTILIDAAGLDMYDYLKGANLPKSDNLITVFTSEPKNWKDASPLYHLKTGLSPFLIYLGGLTYPSITKSNKTFLETLKKFQPDAKINLQEKKKHIPMITQFLFRKNPRYKEISDFMKK
jgi:acetyl esterase/lipase